MALDPDDARPPFRQIADALRASIESGELAPGAKLPPLPALVAEYDVSTNTARAAVAALREAGLVISRQGKGAYVRTRPVETAEHSANLETTVDDLARRVAILEKKVAKLGK
jgi:DNA-binding GntR family transcriptional regulator